MENKVFWKPSELKAVKHHMVDVMVELAPQALSGTTTRLHGSDELLVLAEERAGLPHDRRRGGKTMSVGQILGAQWLDDVRRSYRARASKDFQDKPKEPVKVAEKKPVANGAGQHDPLLRAILSLEARVLALEVKLAQR